MTTDRMPYHSSSVSLDELEKLKVTVASRMRTSAICGLLERCWVTRTKQVVEHCVAGSSRAFLTWRDTHETGG